MTTPEGKLVVEAGDGKAEVMLLPPNKEVMLLPPDKDCKLPSSWITVKRNVHPDNFTLEVDLKVRGTEMRIRFRYTVPPGTLVHPSSTELWGYWNTGRSNFTLMVKNLGKPVFMQSTEVPPSFTDPYPPVNSVPSVYFDIDDTLIDSQDRPRWHVVGFLYFFVEETNANVAIWSGGGKDYAEMWHRRLGLPKEVGAWAKYSLNKNANVLCFDDETDFDMGTMNLIINRA